MSAMISTAIPTMLAVIVRHQGGASCSDEEGRRYAKYFLQSHFYSFLLSINNSHTSSRGADS